MICEFDDVIDSLAVSLHRQHKYVPISDLKQEMWTWWFDPKNVEARDRYLDEGNDGHAKLMASLRNVARSYCLLEQAHALGFEPEDYFFYSKKQIVSLLPYAINPEELAFVASTEKVARSNSDPAEGGNLLAMVADVERVVRRLPREDRTFLALAIQYNYQWDDLGEFLGVKPHTAEVRYYRLVNRVHRRLGGSKPQGFEEYVGSRRVMSNARAIALTTTDDVDRRGE